jgi:hypothetical protein
VRARKRFLHSSALPPIYPNPGRGAALRRGDTINDFSIEVLNKEKKEKLPSSK